MTNQLFSSGMLSLFLQIQLLFFKVTITFYRGLCRNKIGNWSGIDNSQPPFSCQKFEDDFKIVYNEAKLVFQRIPSTKHFSGPLVKTDLFAAVRQPFSTAVQVRAMKVRLQVQPSLRFSNKFSQFVLHRLFGPFTGAVVFVHYLCKRSLFAVLRLSMKNFVSMLTTSTRIRLFQFLSGKHFSIRFQSWSFVLNNECRAIIATS